MPMVRSPLMPKTVDELVARLAMLVAIIGAFVLSTLGIPFLVTSGAAAAAMATALIMPQVTAAVYGWEWPTKEGAIGASAVGFVVALVFLTSVVSSPFGVWPGFWGLVANIVVFVALSLVTSSTPDDAVIRSWRDAMAESTVALDREHREEDVVVSSSDD